MIITTSFPRGHYPSVAECELLAEVTVPGIVRALLGDAAASLRGYAHFQGYFQYPRLSVQIADLQHTVLLSDLTQLDLVTSSLMYLVAHYVQGYGPSCSVAVGAEDGPLAQATAFWFAPTCDDEELSHTAMPPAAVLAVIQSIRDHGGLTGELLDRLDVLHRAVIGCAGILGIDRATLDTHTRE